MTTPGGVLRALAAALDADPGRWPGPDRYVPGVDVDGLRDDEWLYVRPPAWRAITGSPGRDVLAVLHGRGDLAVPAQRVARGEWQSAGPRWAGRPAVYKIRLTALAHPRPDPEPVSRAKPPPAPIPAQVDGRGGQLARFWATAPEWDRSILWRDEDDTGPCPYCGDPGDLAAEPSRTLLYCEACGLLADYPEVRDWRRRHRQGATAPAARQLTPAERAALADDARRQLRRIKRDRLAKLDRALTDRRLTDDSRDDLEDFREQYDRAETPGRIEQLDGQLAGLVIERRSIFAARADIDRYDDDDDPEDIIEGEIVYDDEPEPEPWQPPANLARILPPALVRITAARAALPAVPAAAGYLPCPCGQSANVRKLTASPDGRAWCKECGALLTPATPRRDPNPVLTLSGYEHERMPA